MAEQKLTKNERRQHGREQAKQAREAEKKREKRNRLFLQSGVLVGVLAILAIVALVLVQSAKPAGPGPENMASGGVTFTKDLKVVPTAALAAGAERVAPKDDNTKLPINVTLYADFMCPACGGFEQTYGDMLEKYTGNGDINLTVYPINFLDGTSMGTKYSTRAANLFACVVNTQPDHAFKLYTRLLSPEVQPKENTSGLTDDQLLEEAKAAGVDVTNELRQCVKDRSYAGFINGNYKQVSELGILGLADGSRLVRSSNPPLEGKEDKDLQPADQPQRLTSTPTVIVNGKQWWQPRDGALETYLLKLKADLESESSKKS